MTRYAAFLRGVNVGGVNLKMADVADGADRRRVHRRQDHPRQRQRAARAAGPPSTRCARKPKPRCAKAFGYDAWVLAYDLDDGARDLGGISVRARGRGPPLVRHVRHRRGRSRRTRRSGRRRRVPTRRSNAARASSTGRCPRPRTLDSTIGKTMGKKRYKSSTTTRNLRTLDKVLRVSFGRFATVTSHTEGERRDLTGVSETALLTLQVRATEARRPDSIIDDPMAIQLVDSIDFDFAKFGHTRRQDMALRALAFDAATRALSRGPPRRPPSSRWPRVCRPASTGSSASAVVGDRVPLADRRPAADDRVAGQAAAGLRPGRGVRPVGAGLQLDGPGRHRATASSSPPRDC